MSDCLPEASPLLRLPTAAFKSDRFIILSLTLGFTSFRNSEMYGFVCLSAFVFADTVQKSNRESLAGIQV